MKPRRALHEGHRRKFLVVIDDTPECRRALVYAAKRAKRTAGAVVLLFVIQPGDFQHWLGVEDIMRAEAEEEAQSVLGRFSELARTECGIEPEHVVREGVRSEEIRALIEEDEDIAILVLAAAESSEGPGPLITAIAGRGAATFPIPITIVPPTISDEAMDAIA